MFDILAYLSLHSVSPFFSESIATARVVDEKSKIRISMPGS